MTNLTPNETYISVDVETSGPYPGEYSLLAIGACVVDNPEKTFYVELKPVSDASTEEAIAIHKLSLAELAEHGLEPAEAMNLFKDWLAAQTPEGGQPIFVGFNAAFDWMFVNDYFHRFLGYNPFGHAALDIKSFYMGLAGVPWDNLILAVIKALEGDQETEIVRLLLRLRDMLSQQEGGKELNTQAEAARAEVVNAVNFPTTPIRFCKPALPRLTSRQIRYILRPG